MLFELLWQLHDLLKSILYMCSCSVKLANGIYTSPFCPVIGSVCLACGKA